MILSRRDGFLTIRILADLVSVPRVPGDPMKTNILLQLNYLVAAGCLLTVGCQGRTVSDPIQALPVPGPVTTSMKAQPGSPAGVGHHAANPVHRICCQVAPALAQQSQADNVQPVSYYQDPIANEAAQLQANQFPSPEETLQQPLSLNPGSPVTP